jgi:hypothetical protein
MLSYSSLRGFGGYDKAEGFKGEIKNMPSVRELKNELLTSTLSFSCMLSYSIWRGFGGDAKAEEVKGEIKMCPQRPRK